MLNQLENLAKSVGGSNELIDQWLQARKVLLVTYYHLIGLKPNKEQHTPLDEKALDDFCHNLVDYLSAGHFHVYDRIVADAGSKPAETQSHAQLYAALQANTQSIMAFYDSHLEAAIDHDNYLEFQQALSGVGEALATRFALEDQLIQQAFNYQIIALQAQPAANQTDLARPA
ncbi:sigma D regulator [Biostraticola tofi]|uniref:Regulator of sigma D n=1 Tax=Biostraticola tofi TaxID=466109 RepID=A0A4R3YGU1_9GAMM|nr:sigma D regulator [Biostraticola tofi]TCV91487.1 regulator of sigma D [Biostraticola tofi]